MHEAFAEFVSAADWSRIEQETRSRYQGRASAHVYQTPLRLPYQKAHRIPATSPTPPPALS